MFEIAPDAKIDRVNNCAKIIIHRFRDKISAITHLAHRNEDNKEIQNLVDHWSRCLTLEDFIHGSDQLDNGYRNRPVFSPEDFMTIYNAATGLVDAKSLQKLCRMFSRTLTPYLCQQFLYLKGETRHPNILTSYLSAILILHLFALHLSERSCFLYSMTAKPWIKYRTEEEYQQYVFAPNSSISTKKILLRRMLQDLPLT